MPGPPDPSSEPLLPDNGVLLHIGPHKTGTTALQSAFEESRDALRRLGVTVAPAKLQRVGAAAVAEHSLGGMDVGAFPSRRVWERLCRSVARNPDRRVLVSSEIFSDAKDRAIPGIVADIGADRVRVLITVRPLEKLLPSTWQQAVKKGASAPYEQWLSRVLIGPDHRRLTSSARKFWSRHDHARLAQRWASVVGLDRVAVLIVDESQPEQLLRNTEVLIGVPAGTMRAGTRRNRSLTAQEAEVVRRIYLQLDADVDRRLGQRWIHRGAVTALIDHRRPGPDEPRLVTPPDAIARARELGAHVADRLVSSGVRIVGEPSTLVPDTPIPPASPYVPDTVDDDVAVQLVAGLYRAARADLDEAASMSQQSTGDLVREVGRRTRGKLRRRKPA